MKLVLDDVTDAPKPLVYDEPVEELNARLARGAHDFSAPEPLVVDLEHYRAGHDVVLTGSIRGRLRAQCARCLEGFDVPLDLPVTLLLAPRPDGEPATEPAADDVALAFYDRRAKEIELGPFIDEQTLLALPTRPLCRDDCRGLCAHCGVNLNTSRCDCPSQAGTSPFAGLAALMRERGRASH